MEVYWKLKPLMANDLRFNKENGCMLIGRVGDVSKSTQIGYSSNFLESLREGRKIVRQKLESAIND